MFLANLCHTMEGCVQLMQLDEAGGALKGLHLQRLLQWFVKPVETGEDDVFELAANVLHNMSQVRVL